MEQIKNENQKRLPKFNVKLDIILIYPWICP